MAVPAGESLAQFNGLAVPQISSASNPPSAPRIEFFQSGSSELHRVTIEHSPFRIGRCETSDLQIDSVQVSREHAEIYRRGSIWSIRDLGSTNGTHVNGKPVRESFLTDGDILAIAETELTFVASTVTPFQRMATQPIQPRETSKPPALLPAEIAAMRVMTEATLWQSISLHIATVVSLDNAAVEACFVQAAELASSGQPDSHFNSDHAVGRFYRELSRRRAIELAQAQPAANRIFVTADVADFAAPAQLFSDLDQLRDGMPTDCELGVTISLPNLLDPAALDDVCREIRKADVLLGCVNFQGSSGQVLELESREPDYLVLSDAMLKGVTANSQPLRRLEMVLATCRQLGIKPVLPQCGCTRTIAQCRQIGYELAVQPPPQVTPAQITPLEIPPQKRADPRSGVSFANYRRDCNA